MRGWLAVGVLCVLSLSGCATPSPTSSSSATSSAATFHAHAATNATGAPALRANLTNHAPTANLTAVPGNGTAALNVTFLLSGLDVDGDALNWTLAFGDNGTARTGALLPANVTHAYAAGGLLNVTFTVTDGHNATVATLALNLTGGAAKEPILLTGHVTVPSVSYNTEGECLEVIFTDIFGTPGPGHQFAVPAAAVGGAYSFDVDGMVAIWYDDGLSPTGPEGAAGTVPAGTTQVIACSASAIDTDYTLTILPA
jgi:hypothetical protein